MTVESWTCMLYLMDQIPLFTQRFWTVTELSAFIRKLLEKEPVTQDCWVKGEISNLSRPASGHIYFTLKDSGAALKCVVWRTSASRIRIEWMDGAEVEVHGRITVYETSGQYQLVVDAVQPVGEGFLFQEFLKLKIKLEAEGLFDNDRKRAIPKIPARIGIVTSATGAAIQDMLDTIRRRFPNAEVIFSPASVQGIDAPTQMIDAINRVISEGQPDVVIVARGGGSLEDLWAFNDEQLVRAIGNASVPVVTGIGHETDFTLADFAADLRAPTPTAAAEMVTPNRIDLISQMMGVQKYILDSVNGRIQQKIQELDRQQYLLKRASPQSRIQLQRQWVDDQTDSMTLAVFHLTELWQMQQAGLEHRLSSINPEAVINRGYAIVSKSDTGRVVTSVRQVAKSDKIYIRVKDGGFTAVIDEG